MEQNQAIKQAIEYNRKGFESFFTATEQFQSKAEEYTGQALEQAQFIPEQGKAFARQWIEAGQKARGGVKEAVLKGYERLEQFVTPA